MNVRRNLVVNLIGQGWSALLNLAAVPIYIALLGVEAFGLIGFAAVVLVLATLLDGGMGATLNRSMVLHRASQADLQSTSDLLRSCESTIGGAAVLFGLAALLLGPAFADWWLEPRGLRQDTVATCVVIICFVALIRVIEALYRAALLGLDRPVIVNVLTVVSTTLRVFGPIPVIVFAGDGILTYFWIQLAVSAASLLAFAVATHLELEGHLVGRGRFRFGALRDSLGFAGSAFAIAALGALANQLDKLFVARFVSLDDLGYYSAAAVVAAGIYQLVLPVFQSVYPKLSYLHATGAAEEFDRLFLRLAIVIGFVAGVPIAVIMLFAHDVLFAWTGNEQVALRAAPLLLWVGLGSLGNGLFHGPLAALLAAGRQAIAARTTIVLALVLVPLLFVGWSREGLVGVAAAWGIALACWYLTTLAGTVLLVTGRKVRWPAVVLSLAPFTVALAIGMALREGIGVLPAGQLHRALAIVAIAAFVAVATGAGLWLADRRLLPAREAVA